MTEMQEITVDQTAVKNALADHGRLMKGLGVDVWGALSGNDIVAKDKLKLVMAWGVLSHDLIERISNLAEELMTEGRTTQDFKGTAKTFLEDFNCEESSFENDTNLYDAMIYSFMAWAKNLGMFEAFDLMEEKDLEEQEDEQETD